MKIINLESTQRLRINDKKYIGKEFNFWQKVRKGGVGSAQFIYKDGVPAWDSMNKDFDYKMLCSIELVEKGIVLWMNKRQLVHAALIPYEEIKSISMKGFKLSTKPLTKVNEIVHAADLKIEIEEYGYDLEFYVPAPKFQSLNKFFSKHFKDRYFSAVSNAEPIESEEPIYTSIYLHGLMY